MNYLAHAYLSFGHEEILTGNMISDFVKGRQQYDYPPLIHKGIILHRHIDTFTDNHGAIAEAKEVFRKEYRLYSGAFVDVAFDYFLANDENEFTDKSLFDFSLQTYRSLAKFEEIMPERFRKMLFYMRSQNWLYNYLTHYGIHQSFGGLVRRSKYLESSEPAIRIFEEHFEFLNRCYNRFWKELKPFAKNKLNELLNEK